MAQQHLTQNEHVQLLFAKKEFPEPKEQGEHFTNPLSLV